VKKVVLGRPSNNVKMGVVGLPNVGKSSFFNILCGMNVPAGACPAFPAIRDGEVPAARVCGDTGQCRVVPSMLASLAIRGRLALCCTIYSCDSS
jgi:hypothetical protein